MAGLSSKAKKRNSLRIGEESSHRRHPALFIAAVVGLRTQPRPSTRGIDSRRGSMSYDSDRLGRSHFGVATSVTQRIQKLKTLEVELNWGGHGAKKKSKSWDRARPHDLVFQSLRTRVPMNDLNILHRHLRPAAKKLNIDPAKATWRSLRRSWATWMAQSGADPKSVQAQMRHSRILTTMDIYAQCVPEAQGLAVARTMEMLNERRKQAPLVN